MSLDAAVMEVRRVLDEAGLRGNPHTRPAVNPGRDGTVLVFAPGADTVVSVLRDAGYPVNRVGRYIVVAVED